VPQVTAAAAAALKSKIVAELSGAAAQRHTSAAREGAVFSHAVPSICSSYLKLPASNSCYCARTWCVCPPPPPPPHTCWVHTLLEQQQPYVLPVTIVNNTLGLGHVKGEPAVTQYKQWPVKRVLLDMLLCCCELQGGGQSAWGGGCWGALLFVPLSTYGLLLRLSTSLRNHRLV
jgi:hypothetical protein